MNKLFPIKLDKEGLLALSRAYMNKNDQAYAFFKKIDELDGYEDILIHADEKGFIYETTGGTNIIYTASELADILRSDFDAYHGKDIRLLSCGSGRLSDGLAQQLADELQVNVLAPTETLWIRDDGALFISDSNVLAEMWNEHIDVKASGEWKAFIPNKKER